MIIRKMLPGDVPQLVDIHQKFYTNEFVFTEFDEHFLNYFVTIEDGKIISGGGVRTIAESVIVTDLSATRQIRKEALLLILKEAIKTCNIHNYDQLHAFVQDPKWEKVLRKYGFQDNKAKGLYLWLRETLPHKQILP